MRKKRYPYRTSVVVNGHRYDIKAKTRQEMMDKVEAKRTESIYVNQDTYTVRDWVDICMDNYKPNLTPSAKAGYISKCKHFTELLGPFKLWQVTPIMCQTTIDVMQGYSEYTIRKVRELMYFCFQKAVTYQLIPVNPAADISMPECKKSHRRRELTPEERKKVMNTISKRPEYLMYAFALYCGCRPQEASNIRSSDIKDGMLHIRGTKTENADRYVPIPEVLKDLIPDNVTGYLVTDSNGNPMSANTRRRTWIKFREDAGLPDDVVCYNLRHTYASSLCRAGVNISIASRLMGHSSISITNDIYTHVDLSHVKDASQILNEYWNDNQ